MKPTPPDQDRIEIIINGDDPESHKAAQESARILAAPQIAKTIQKQIDECRERIEKVMSSILNFNNSLAKVRQYVKWDDSSRHDLDKLCDRIYQIPAQCISPEHQIRYAEIMSAISNSKLKPLNRINLRENRLKDFTREMEERASQYKWEGPDANSWYDRGNRPDLWEKYLEIERKKDELKSKRDKLAREKKLEMEKNDDKAEREDLQALVKCFEDIVKILNDSNTRLNQEIKKYETQLDDLFALVKGK